MLGQYSAVASGGEGPGRPSQEKLPLSGCGHGFFLCAVLHKMCTCTCTLVLIIAPWHKPCAHYVGQKKKWFVDIGNLVTIGVFRNNPD